MPAAPQAAGTHRSPPAAPEQWHVYRTNRPSTDTTHACIAHNTTARKWSVARVYATAANESTLTSAHAADAPPTRAAGGASVCLLR
jgi:hypothetical protein